MNDITPSGPAARARDLAPAIEAAADQIEQTRRLPARLLTALRAAALFPRLRPPSVGGDEIDPGVYVQAIEELSRADGSVGWCVSIANSTGLIAPYLDREGARTIWGDQ